MTAMKDLKHSGDAFVNDLSKARRTMYVNLAEKSRADLERRYRDCRDKLNDLQVGQILRMYTSGLDSRDISRSLRIPHHTVRTVISYACTQNLLIYNWHYINRPDICSANSEVSKVPIRPESYIRYAPVI